MQAVIKPGETFSMESIGCAIYTSMAFLNHSCNPNTIKYWEGDRIILVASQPIRKGDEITDNYGMHFLNNHKAQRQDWLQVDNILIFENKFNKHHRNNRFCWSSLPLPQLKAGLTMNNFRNVTGSNAIAQLVSVIIQHVICYQNHSRKSNVQTNIAANWWIFPRTFGLVLVVRREIIQSSGNFFLFK